MTAASKATIVIGFSTRRSDLFRHHALLDCSARRVV